MKRIAMMAAASFVLPAAAAAGYAGFQSAESRVGFVSKQMNVPVEGRFKKLDGRLAFDPARPAEGSARLEIDLASIDTGLDEANQEAVGKEWFDVARFPRASFESSTVEALGGNRYKISGKLTIKGRSHPVATTATFSQKGPLGIFEGSFTLQRSDYGIGEGIWSTFETVANEVKIDFRIAAPAAN